MDRTVRGRQREKEDAMLDHAIYYVLHRSYPRELTKEKKRAVCKRATNLIVEKGKIQTQCSVVLLVYI